MLRSDLAIPLPLSLFLDYDDVAGVDCDQTPADVGVFHVPFKCAVVRAQLNITETFGGTTTGVVAFDKRPTLGSDTDRGAADIANFVCGTTAAGKVLYDEVAVGTILLPGEEVVIQIVTQPATGSPAGHFRPDLLVEILPEVITNLTNLVETA